GVAEIEIRLDPDLVVLEAFAVQIFPRLLDQLIEQAVDFVEIEIFQAGELGAHVVVLDVRHEQPQRRVYAGGERDQHGGNAQVERHAPGVHRSAAAERDQSEIADI